MYVSQSQPVPPGGRRWSFLLGAVASAMLLGVGFGCKPTSSSTSDETHQASPPEAPEVKASVPEKKDVRRLIDRPVYNSEAYERTMVYAKIAGYVQKWNFDMGKH